MEQMERSGLHMSRMGLGTWAIGGVWYDGNTPLGWGNVDDHQSIAALRRAVELGVNYFDTANIYGAGHSEEVLGRAFRGIREHVVLSTKFGILCDPVSKRITGQISTPDEMRRSLEDSLRRLQTDYIDLYLFHLSEVPEEQAVWTRETLESFVREGKIHYYGWSTENPACARVFAQGHHCAAFMHIENLLEDHDDMISLCRESRMISICRSPLCMGLLTGKYRAGSSFGKDDLRGAHAPAWMQYFHNGEPNADMLKRLDAVRDVLTSNGRTLAQGCLAWLWGRFDGCVPVPGFRSMAQVEDNIGAMRYGPLTPVQMAEIERILSSEPV